jgi:hypothetical protein
MIALWTDQLSTVLLTSGVIPKSEDGSVVAAEAEISSASGDDPSTQQAGPGTVKPLL